MGELLKDKRLLVTIGIFLLILLILVAGGLFGLNTFNQRMIAIAIVLFLWMLFNIFERVRAARMSSKLEQSLKAQADAQVLSVRPDKKAEIEQLQQDLIMAIESLKKSKLSKGRRGSAALYALPWQLIMGPPAAGKTTAIINSGLDFPFGKKIKGVGGTRNCDWFFSTSAVFLDTAGRYMTEDEDKEEWFAFLDVLKKYRRRMPLNGVIVGISISDILNSSIEEIERHALKMRNRIDELITRLGVRFPVYLVFTKCDLMQGFVDFFQELSRRERDQIWGCTFSRESHEHPDPKALFEKEFKILYKSLVNLRMQRLGGTQSRGKRRNLYVFPLQFASARENLTQFVSKLFQPNPYHESPLFRGFYFTSGTQEGLPIDKVIQSIAGKFNLPEIAPVQEEVVEKKSYFINNLFTKIIIPDQNIGGHTSRAARNRQLVRLGTVGAAVLITILFFASILRAFINSRNDLSRVQHYAESVSKIDARKRPLDYFQYLDAFRETVVNAANGPSSLNWNMDRGDEVLAPSIKLYVNKIRPIFISRYFFDKLQRKLSESVNSMGVERDQMYDDLKSYLLVGNHVDRLDSLENLIFLKKSMANFFDEYLFGTMNSSSVQKLRPVVMRNVDFFVDCLAKKYVSPYEIDTDLVTRVRNKVKTPPSIRNFYRNLINSVTDLESITLMDAIGRSYQDILNSSYEIPGAFTKQGWERIEEKIKRESQNIGKKDWVMGDVATFMPAEWRDRDYVTQELEKMYFAEYAERWWAFLSNIEYAPFRNLSTAVENIKILGYTRDSPLMQIFEFVSKQTRFENALLSGVANKTGGIIDKTKRKLGLSRDENISERLPGQDKNIVNREFSDIHAWTSSTDNSGSQSDLTNILREYDDVSALLEGMSGEPGPLATEYAAKVLKQPTASELYSSLNAIKRILRAIDPNAEQAVQDLFEKPIQMTWTVILKNAQMHLNTLWREQVYDEFQYTLAQYYPFNKGGNDATINDLDRFFQPQNGIFGKFYSEHLEPFLRMTTRKTWTINRWLNEGIVISQNTQTSLMKARNIANGLFSSGGLAIQFSLEPVLPVVRGGESPYQICLNIDGKEDCYQMGHPRVTAYNWPGFQGSQGARLNIDTRIRSYEYANERGTWGWFRLLDKATKIRRLSSSEYVIHWEYRYDSYQVDVIYKLKTQSTYNPFSNFKNFFNFKCPSSLN